MNADDIRRWSENHAVAAARELKEMRRNPLSPAAAFKAALSLLAFDEAQNGSPFERPHDTLEAEDDEKVRNVWTTLRLRWKREL